jgi:hypothetical protein
MKTIFVLTLLLFLSACASKAPMQGGALLNDKEAVLELINVGIPDICSYSGRVTVRYDDPYNNLASSALLQKRCEGGMAVKMLGPFGIVLAELTVDNGSYSAFQGEKDVTESVVINGEDIILMNRYLKLPPPTPDSTYLMVVDNRRYIFVKGNQNIYVDTNFRTAALVTPDHQVSYIWDGDRLQTLLFNRQATSLSVEFIDPWVAN